MTGKNKIKRIWGYEEGMKDDEEGPKKGRQDILKTDKGLVQLVACPKCNYLVMLSDTVNEDRLCKWCNGST